MLRKSRNKSGSKRKKVISIILWVIGILFLLAIAVVLYFGISFYSALNYEPIGDSTILQSQADAAVLLEQGVSLNDILKDDSQFRFTLDEVDELKTHYMDLLESDIVEGDDAFVFVYPRGRDLTLDDFAKQAIHIAKTPLSFVFHYYSTLF